MRDKQADSTVVYRRGFARPRSPHVCEEIAKLDARDDCERIVHLLSAYEFPFDLQRSMELALFHTYGSRSVAALLDRTGEFEKHGQKRYDDTRLLIAHFMENGWSSELGARALEQMNHIHGHFQIPNDDFLFVLWTFIDFPIQWMRDFGWRAFTERECEAWFCFWCEIGSRMGLRDIPPDRRTFDAFVCLYEMREFVLNPASPRVAKATLKLMAAWLPRPLRPLVTPVTRALVRPQLLLPLELETPSRTFRWLVRSTLVMRGWLKRYVSFEQHPTRIESSLNRTYPGNTYTIRSLGPEFAHRRATQPIKKRNNVSSQRV